MRHVNFFNEYDHYICLNCGYENFQSFNKKILAKIYENDTDYNSDIDIAKDHKDLIQWNHVQAIPHLKKIATNRRTRILDIGCFNGFFVRELIDRGFDAMGIDFNRNAVEFGQSTYQLYGHISSATLDDLFLQKERFDAITMFEVIEHLEDFASVIQQALRLLHPDGVMIISTPNNRMCWRPELDFPPHHLSRFSPTSLKHLMENTGLKVLFQAEQTSSFDLLRNYAGSLFRKKSAKSLRGGQFRNRQLANRLRTIANRSKWLIYRISAPIDALLHSIGIRYISQIIVGQKKS